MIKSINQSTAILINGVLKEEIISSNMSKNVRVSFRLQGRARLDADNREAEMYSKDAHSSFRSPAI